MSLTRRYFLKSAALAGAAAAAPRIFAQDEEKQSSSPNEKLGVAVVGTGGRGGEHIAALTKRDDVEILYLCDADISHAYGKQKSVEERQGTTPKLEQEMRKVFDDPAVDIVSIATPNHWHSLSAIWAMQAGKDVYVEKPVSHNVWEGRQMVNWARHLKKICQCGTQSRSSDSLHEAVKFVRDGELGPIQYAIGTCYKPRMSIGKLDRPLELPDSLDYDLWCGPAAMVDLYRPQLHYDWHWDFNTGNGDMGNQGIHQMDIARWFLGESALSPRVMSIGARVGYDDAGNTPNTQIVFHDYDKAPLIFETRGLPEKKMDRWGGRDMDRYRGSQIGVIIQCENGYVVVPNYTSAKAFDNDGNQLQSWSVTENREQNANDRHFANFMKGVRSRNHEDLNADILEGHLSSALCHTGNISHLVGEKKPSQEIQQHVADNPRLADSYERMAEHLAANEVDIESPTLVLGPMLEMDPQAESFPKHEAADRLLTRDYRGKYVVTEPS